MKELNTLWIEKRYQEIINHCRSILENDPANWEAQCTYSKSEAATSTLMQPKISQATEDFFSGLVYLKKQKPDDMAQKLDECFTGFSEALTLAQNNILGLFLPICKYEASIGELRNAMLSLLDATLRLINEYTEEMLTGETFRLSYLSFCRCGLKAAEEYCKTRGFERIAGKVSSISVNYVLPEDRQPVIEKYDLLWKQMHKLNTELQPSKTIERTQPKPERMQAAVSELQKILKASGEEIIHDESPKKCDLFKKLFH